MRARRPRGARGLMGFAGLAWAVGWLLAVVACSGDERAGLVAETAVEAAPDFALPLLGGGEIALAKLRGRIVVLDFWATWCAPCEVQMPILDALHRERGGEQLAVVGLSVDTDPPASVSKWIEERGFRYPIALASQSLAVDYGLLGFPSLVLIDEEGSIRARHTGVWSREEIDEAIEAIRARPRSAPAP